MSLGKIIFGRNIQFNSNRIEDRIDAVIAAVESENGLQLTPTKVDERELRDADGNPVKNDKGEIQKTKVYSFKNELVG